LLSFVKACSFHAHKDALTAASHAVDKTRAATVQQLCTAGMPKDKAITKARDKFPRQPEQNVIHGSIKTYNRSARDRSKQLMRFVLRMDSAPLGHWVWEPRANDHHQTGSLVYGYTFRPADGAVHEVLQAGDQLLRVGGKSVLKMLAKPTPALASDIWSEDVMKRVEIKVFRPTNLERGNQERFAAACAPDAGSLRSCLCVAVVLI